MKFEHIKKLILCFVLICMGVFVTLQKEQFYIEKEYSASDTVKDSLTGEAQDPSEISLDGNQLIEQYFIAREDELFKVKIDFKAWEQRNGSGTITVKISTPDGEELASAEKKISSLVQSKTSTQTSFSLPAKLEKGSIYVLSIKSNDLESTKGCYVYEMQEKGSTFDTLYVNGEALEGRIKATFIMNHFAGNSQIFMYLILAGTFIFVLIPVSKLDKMIEKRNGREKCCTIILSRILFFAAVPMAFFIMQRYSGYGIGSFLRLCKTLKGVTNLFLFGMIWWLLYILVNRTKYTAVLLTLISTIAGLVNYFVWNFRGIPIMAADILSVGTAMDVAQHYEYLIDIHATWALVCAVSFLCLVLSLQNYKGISLKKRLCVAVAFLLPYGIFYTQLLHGTLMKDHGITVSVWEPQRNYAKNGSLLSFFLSYTYYAVEKPEQYSVERVAEIASQYESDSIDTTAERPNVIVIMNEAFSDLSVDGSFETSEDYMPFIRNLKEDTIKGDLYVSVLAGNTANTEFEFLTGCSMSFLPFRCIPYDTYIKGEFPSLTKVLKENGYAGNLAVHPGTASAWNRNNVYDYFGFDEFFSASDMKEKEYIRNFVSDASDFEFVIQQYEETRKETEDPFYGFTVTIQNHGGYSASQGLIDTPIEILDEDKKDDAAQQYINLIKKTDEAYEELVEYFRQIEEPTVIVMFGDHQPSLSNSFYESLIGKKTEKFTLEDTINQYTVPYIIWANYDIEEQEADMSANYLSAFLMKVIGGRMSAYQKYLCDLYEEVPLITANGYRGADGVLHELDEKSDYSEAIEDYKMIQYNNIFDDENRLEAFYQLAEE